jgi:hypothetical protein
MNHRRANLAKFRQVPHSGWCQGLIPATLRALG